jgi:hypothetical protein
VVFNDDRTPKEHTELPRNGRTSKKQTELPRVEEQTELPRNNQNFPETTRTSQKQPELPRNNQNFPGLRNKQDSKATNRKPGTEEQVGLLVIGK